MSDDSSDKSAGEGAAGRGQVAREVDYLDQWASLYNDFYPDKSRLDLEYRLSRMMVLAGRSWMYRIDHILQVETGQSRARWQALFALAFAPQPATMTELSRRLRVRWPTLVRVLNGMEQDGLIAREDNPADGRSKLVHLTAKGEAVMTRIQPTLDRERSQILRNLSEQELKACAALLGTIFEDTINP